MCACTRECGGERDRRKGGKRVWPYIFCAIMNKCVSHASVTILSLGVRKARQQTAVLPCPEGLSGASRPKRAIRHRDDSSPSGSREAAGSGGMLTAAIPHTLIDRDHDLPALTLRSTLLLSTFFVFKEMFQCTWILQS